MWPSDRQRQWQQEVDETYARGGTGSTRASEGTWGRRKKHVDDHLLTEVMEWDKTTGYGWTQCLDTDSGLLYNPHIECRLSQIDHRLSAGMCVVHLDISRHASRQESNCAQATFRVKFLM